ncbi:MAG: peptide deformylase [Tidjanibacter sp.]|nr:peptide deformylase [Tidjanibacter sp.]
MIYPIYIYGSSVLRKESVDLTPDFPELKQLVEDMFSTMYASDGVGLAAPQIGKDIRLFVVDASPMASDDPKAAGFKRAFINPEIYDESEEEVLMNEGCLSLPGIHEDVYRPETIKVHYWDEEFVEHDEELSGWPARVVQHENDHIEGLVFTDHLTPLRKTLLRNKLKAMASGKFEADYRTKLTK